MENTEKIIEIPLKNQNYTITQEFIDELFKYFKMYHVIETSFISMNNDNEKSVKLIMTVVDDFLNQISKSENNLIEFNNIELVKKYNKSLIMRNIIMINNYLDDYSENFECDHSFFWSSLPEYVSNDILVNSFYFYFVNTNYISKIANISKTKEEYVNNILQILKDLNSEVSEIKDLTELDKIVLNYFASSHD